MRLTAFELPARWNAVDEAFAEVEALLAAGPATDLVLLPEASLTGYVSPSFDADLSKFAEPLEGPTCRRLSELAQRFGTHLVGPLVERDSTALYNALVGFRPNGERFLHYRKRHPWYPETWATAGASQLPLGVVDGYRVTAAICFDLHFVAAESAPTLRAADVLLFPSAWVEEADSRLTLLSGLAREFNLQVINANWGPGVVSLPGQGSSMFVDQSGRTRVIGRGERRLDVELEGVEVMM